LSLANGIRFATRIHANDKRKYNGEAYINHCLRVMHRTIMHPITQEERYATGSVCHDTVEDHPGCESEFSGLFGFEIYWVVGHLTNVYVPSKYPKMNRAERKRREVERLAACTDPIKVIKMLDRIDNLEGYLSDSHNYRNDFQGRYTEDPTAFGLLYSFESVNLLNAIGDPDSALRDEGLLLCYRMIELAVCEGHNLRHGEKSVFESLEHLTREPTI